MVFTSVVFIYMVQPRYMVLVLVSISVLKNLPIVYDLRQYQPYTNTSLVWDLR
jgi:hypothetical protein